MKSNVVMIDNKGNGFAEALEETAKVADFEGLGEKNALHLRLIAEEMLSLARSITGEMRASYWIENEGANYRMSMATQAVMDKVMRERLIASSTSRKNEAAETFLGRLRDSFERAMALDPAFEDSAGAIPDEVGADVSWWRVEDSGWDGYERSVLRAVADDVKVFVRGNDVELTVSKTFA